MGFFAICNPNKSTDNHISIYIFQLSKKVESTALQRKIFAKIATKTDLFEVKDLLNKLKACCI